MNKLTKENVIKLIKENKSTWGDSTESSIISFDGIFNLIKNNEKFKSIKYDEVKPLVDTLINEGKIELVDALSGQLKVR